MLSTVQYHRDRKALFNLFSFFLNSSFSGLAARTFITEMANLKYISRFIIFGRTLGMKWTLQSDVLAKKKQLSFYEGLGLLRPQLKRVFYYLGQPLW